MCEGKWDEALELAKSALWGRKWVARQLAKAANVAKLAELAERGMSEAQEELARILAERGELDELHRRTAKGDGHCAQQLVTLAQRNLLPRSAQLLARGLRADGTYDLVNDRSRSGSR